MLPEPSFLDVCGDGERREQAREAGDVRSGLRACAEVVPVARGSDQVERERKRHRRNADAHPAARAASANETAAPMYPAPKNAAVNGALIVHAQ